MVGICEASLKNSGHMCMADLWCLRLAVVVLAMGTDNNRSQLQIGLLHVWADIFAECPTVPIPELLAFARSNIPFCWSLDSGGSL